MSHKTLFHSLDQDPLHACLMAVETRAVLHHLVQVQVVRQSLLVVAASHHQVPVWEQGPEL